MERIRVNLTLSKKEYEGVRKTAARLGYKTATGFASDLVARACNSSVSPDTGDDIQNELESIFREFGEWESANGSALRCTIGKRL